MGIQLLGTRNVNGLTQQERLDERPGPPRKEDKLKYCETAVEIVWPRKEEKMSEIEKKLDAGKVYLGFRTYYDRESVDSLLSEVTRLQAELELERAWVKALEIVDTRHGVKLVDRLKQSENRVTELEAERRRDALDGQATMEEAYDRIKELESKKDARIKTLEEGIGKARNLVENIQCSRKVSIGSLDNTYAVQLDVIRVDNLADLLKELDG